MIPCIHQEKSRGAMWSDQEQTSARNSGIVVLGRGGIDDSVSVEEGGDDNGGELR